jgi:hypothetical protein
MPAGCVSAKRRRGRDWTIYLVDGLECFLEGALTQSRSTEIRSPEQVRVTKHELYRLGGGLLIKGYVRPPDDPTRLYHVAYYLDVEGPVSGIVKYENGGNGHFGKVGRLALVGPHQ